MKRYLVVALMITVGVAVLAAGLRKSARLSVVSVDDLQSVEAQPTPEPRYMVYVTNPSDEGLIAQGLARVRTYSLTLLESFPVQVHADVVIDVPAGYKLGQAKVEQIGTTFDVDITWYGPPEESDEEVVTREVHHVVPLDVRGLDQRQYTVDINGVGQEFLLDKETDLEWERTYQQKVDISLAMLDAIRNDVLARIPYYLQEVVEADTVEVIIHFNHFLSGSEIREYEAMGLIIAERSVSGDWYSQSLYRAAVPWELVPELVDRSEVLFIESVWQPGSVESN
jgi:hypothetical protein